MGQYYRVLTIENNKTKLCKNIIMMRTFCPQHLIICTNLEEENEKPNSIFPPAKETAGPLVPANVWDKQAAYEPRESILSGGEDTGKAIVEKLDGLQYLLQQQLIKADEEKREKENQEDKTPSEIMTFMKLLYNTMIENEVHEKYANELIDEIEKKGTPDMQMDMMLSNVYQKMILKFGQADLIVPSEKKPKIIYFIGPTGVGKTTTIAKIASKFCIEEKKQIQFAY